MIDKEIIINEVDVSGCEYYGSQNNCIVYGNQGCNKFYNCYYKQFKRKKQECKKLRRKLDYYIIKTIRLLDEIDILKGINNYE